MSTSSWNNLDTVPQDTVETISGYFWIETRGICLGELANFPSTLSCLSSDAHGSDNDFSLAVSLYPLFFPEFLFLCELLFVFLPISALQFDSHKASKTKPTVRLHSAQWTFYVGKCQKNFQNYHDAPTHTFLGCFSTFFISFFTFLPSFLLSLSFYPFLLTWLYPGHSNLC